MKSQSFLLFNHCEKILYETPTISVVLKSWLVFYRFGLNDPPMFEVMKFDNHRPWRHMDLYWNVPQWVFHPTHTRPIQNTLFVEEAAREWECLLDYWFEVCFVNNTCFEVVVTETMGLGIRITIPSSFNDLTEALLGVLEPLSFMYFDLLHGSQYPSLYEFVDDDEDRIFSVLYGPLSLVNADLQAPLGFEHFNTLGFDLLVCFTYTYGEVVEEFDEKEDILEISTIYLS